MNPRVLDTSIASMLLNKSPALNPYTPYFNNALLAISFQTVAEMRFGALKAQWAEPRRQALEQFMSRYIDLRPLRQCKYPPSPSSRHQQTDPTADLLNASRLILRHHLTLGGSRYGFQPDGAP